MDFIRAQLTRIPRITPVNLSACTVLITGANSGLGLAASREVLMSSPKRLILAVRNLDEGNKARSELMGRGKPTLTEIEVRKLDQNNFESVASFAKSLKGDRVDFAILNAGVMNCEFITSADGLESELQVNVLSPALLSLLLLPNFHLASSSPKPPSTPRPHLTFVSSGLHTMAKFPERKLGPGEILPALNNRAQYSQSDRYSVSKTIGLLWMRELARRVQSSDIVINAVNPGFCKTGLMRNTSGVMYYLSRVAQFLLGREVEDGARCLVDAAIIKGPETHGLYLSEMQVKAESDLVRSAEGKELEGRLWEEIVALLGQHGLDVENLP